MKTRYVKFKVPDDYTDEIEFIRLEVGFKYENATVISNFTGTQIHLLTDEEIKKEAEFYAKGDYKNGFETGMSYMKSQIENQ